MHRCLLLIVVGLIVGVGAPLFAQGGSTKSALSGLVVDGEGGVLPGATVDVRNMRTGVTTSVVTNGSGAFDAPALDAGIYRVTVSLAGFKTAALTDVELISGVSRAVRVVLELGGVEETVEVRGGSQLVQTQSTTVAATIRSDQIQALPLVARNALNFIVFLPGVDTTSNNHLQRDSTIAGLPESTLSITVDGANVQDKYTRSTDGFFANIQPRLDAIEEATVTSATAGADASGNGAVQIRFVTRGGTNTFVGSAYEYLRHDKLNSNTYFNRRNGLPKNPLELNQFGARQGGPIVIPGLYDGRNKAFFFVNYEQLRFPVSNTRTRGVLSPLAQQGLFRYGAGGGTQIDLLALAARNGQTSTIDPTIAALVAKIRASAAIEGVFRDRTDPNVQDFIWQPASLRIDNVPTGRLDFNLSDRHRLTASYQYQGQRLTPNLFGGDEPNFPGLSNQAELYSAVSRGSTSLRSTLANNKVNELRVAYSNAPVFFADSVGPSQFDEQGGFNINFPNIGSALTGAGTQDAPSSRNGKSLNVDNTFNWLFGAHSIQFGGSFSRISGWNNVQTLVPQLTLGVDVADPANAMFSTANFPGASTTDLTNARALYAMLTGRVTQIASNVRLDPETGRYVYLGRGGTREHQDEIGLFVQDSWRVTPTFTVNAGVRWQLAMPFEPSVSVYSMNTLADLCGVSGPGAGAGDRGCNLFNPGVFNGVGRVPTYQLYDAGSPGYNTDYDNFGPNVGVAWQPNVQSGWLRAILGDPEQATIRASAGVAFNSDGLGFYRDSFNANPGNTVNTTRSATSTQFPLVGPGQSWPVLMRDVGLLGPSPNIPEAPQYPMPINFNSGINMFDPNYKTPSARSYSVGVQRALGSLTALEVRYVGTRLVDGFTNENWNEVNFTSNGFLDEFQRAQQNLQSHIAAGCGQAGAPACTFAYRGPGTHPLPIYLAAFTGASAALAGDPSRYTGTNWTSAQRLTELARHNPTPGPAATALFTDAAFRANMIAAGYPSNFFVLNPHVLNAMVRTNGGRTRYDSVQILLRRAMSDGFAFDLNYTGARRFASVFGQPGGNVVHGDTLRREQPMIRSVDGVPHALKMTAIYDLPFGRGRRFGAGMNGVVDAVAGGWSLNLTGRAQSGSILNFGNVRVVGMTEDELRDAFKIRIDEASGIVYTLPQDIIDNTIRAFSTSATTASGYGALGAPTGRYLAPPNGPDCIQEARGDCAPHDVFVQGPIFTRFDLTVKKRFPLGGRRNFELSADVLNVFNAINFLAVAQASSSATLNQVTNSYQDPNVTLDPGGRLVQLVFRVNF
ncbi:MAG TPA: carboxypeptidase-like regulatory domain-containing protein [Vicinamibacterales bacterium]|nr:carboxypeptidase-like regulatory domain-containing protein [Vicinamibacterales bacterium]